MDKRQKAVALRYKPERDAAPKVAASGQGYLAQRIIERGEEAGVRVHKDSALVEELYKVEIGEQIPPELYEVVARVLVFINELDKRYDKEALGVGRKQADG